MAEKTTSSSSARRSAMNSDEPRIDYKCFSLVRVRERLLNEVLWITAAAPSEILQIRTVKRNWDSNCCKVIVVKYKHEEK